MGDGILHLKYRPKTFKEVLGHGSKVRELIKELKDGTARSFIFVGPAGVGKTTLAHLVAKEVGCTNDNLIRINAAQNTGIDAMKEKLSNIQFSRIGGGSRVYIVDECHRLSANAWDSMLDDVEHPPKGIYFCFCTTETRKIPATIMSRCSKYFLGQLPRGDIQTILEKVKEGEGYKTKTSIITIISRKCGGSARTAISAFGQLRNCTSNDLAAKRMNSIIKEEEGVVGELVRLLIKGKPSWDMVAPIVKKMGDSDAEDIRRGVFNYLSAVLLNSKNESWTKKIAGIMDFFSDPYPPGGGAGHIALSLCYYLYR